MQRLLLFISIEHRFRVKGLDMCNRYQNIVRALSWCLSRKCSTQTDIGPMHEVMVTDGVSVILSV